MSKSPDDNNPNVPKAPPASSAPALDPVPDAPEPPGIPDIPGPPEPPEAPEAPSSKTEEPVPPVKDEFEGLSKEEKKNKLEHRLNNIKEKIKKEEGNKKIFQSQITAQQQTLTKHQQQLVELQEKINEKQKHYETEKRRFDQASKLLPGNDPRRQTILSEMEVMVEKMQQDITEEKHKIAQLENDIATVNDQLQSIQGKVLEIGKNIQSQNKEKEQTERALGIKGIKVARPLVTPSASAGQAKAPDIAAALKSAMKTRRGKISGESPVKAKIPLDQDLIDKYAKLENFTHNLQGEYNVAPLYILKQELFPANRLEQNEGLRIIDDEKFLEKLREALGKDKEFVNKIESVLKTKFDPKFTLEGIVASLNKKQVVSMASPSDAQLSPAMDAPPMAPAMDAPPMAPAMNAPPMAPAMDAPPLSPEAPAIAVPAAAASEKKPVFGVKIKALTKEQLRNLQSELNKLGFPNEKNKDKTLEITALTKTLEAKESKKLKFTGESPIIANKLNVVKAEIETIKNEIAKIKADIEKINKDIKLLEGQSQYKELIRNLQEHILGLNKKLLKIEGDPDKKIEGILQRKEKLKETGENDKKKNEDNVALVNSEIKYLKDSLVALGVKPATPRQSSQAPKVQGQANVKELAKKYAQIENYNYDQHGNENVMILLDLKDKLFGKNGLLVEREKIVRKEQDKLDSNGKVIGKVIVSETIPILKPETPGVAISDQDFREKVNAAINFGRMKPEKMEEILSEILGVKLQEEKQKNPEFSVIDMLEKVRTSKNLEDKLAEQAKKQSEIEERSRSAVISENIEPEKSIKAAVKTVAKTLDEETVSTPSAPTSTASTATTVPQEDVSVVVEPKPMIAADLEKEAKSLSEPQTAIPETPEAELPKGRWDYLHEGETAEEKQNRELGAERVRLAGERMTREHNEAMAGQVEKPLILSPNVSPEAIAEKQQRLQQKMEETKALQDKPIKITNPETQTVEKLKLSDIDREMQSREMERKELTSQFASRQTEQADRISHRQKLDYTKKILDTRFPKEHLLTKIVQYLDKYDPSKGGKRPQTSGIFKSDQVEKQKIARAVQDLLTGDTLARAVVGKKLDDVLAKIQTAIKDNRKAHKGFSEGQLSSILKEFERIVKNIKKEQEHIEKLKPPTPSGPKSGST